MKATPSTLKRWVQPVIVVVNMKRAENGTGIAPNDLLTFNDDNPNS